MRTRLAIFIMMLLSATLGAQAQKRIKVIDITVQMPKVGADIIDEDAKVTAIKTDVFGSKNMLGDDKIGDAGVGFFEYDTTGKPVVPAADAKFEAGRDYQMVVSVTNFTDVLFNYKNDKEFTADNTTLKVTVNGEPANIITASGRPLQCELRVTMGGKRNPYLANTKVSAADGEHSGYGYVDLGLPSGTKWATCNVGAAKPEAYGDFYGYGETKTKKEFWEKNFEGYGSSLYNNSKRLGSYAEEDNLYSVSTSMEHKLKPEYDAARQSMGGEWSLPTRMQHKELVENTSAKFIIVNGVKGTLYTSLKNGKSIFVPYAGHKIGGVVHDRGTVAVYLTANSHRSTEMYAYVWGSAYHTGKKGEAAIFSMYGHGADEDNTGYPTYQGYSVRAVFGGKEVSDDKVSGKGSKKGSKKGDSSEDKGVMGKAKGLLKKGKSLFDKL